MKTQLSQKDRILRRLNAGAMCSMEPLDWSPRIYRVAARVLDLRGDGHEIVTDICGEHGQNHAVYRPEPRRLPIARPRETVHMNPEECTNPSKPCGLHEPANEWRIEVGRTTMHSGWFVAAVVVIIIVSIGFN